MAYTQCRLLSQAFSCHYFGICNGENYKQHLRQMHTHSCVGKVIIVSANSCKENVYYVCRLVDNGRAVQQAPCMHVISVYFGFNVCKLYNGPIRSLADHDFTVRCIQVESIHTAIVWCL